MPLLRLGPPPRSAGETNPAKLASLAYRRVRASHEELREALRGRVTKNHRFLLRLHLNQIDTAGERAERFVPGQFVPSKDGLST